MTKLLTEAVEAAAALPEGMQNEIGGTILDHVQKLHKLQREVGLGLNSLERTGGRDLSATVWREMKAKANSRVTGK